MMERDGLLKSIPFSFIIRSSTVVVMDYIMKKFLILIPMIISLTSCVVIVQNTNESQSNEQTQTLTDNIDNLNNILERLIAKINRYR